MTWLSVDRIENNYLVCEDSCGNVSYINFKTLPANITEGSVIDVLKNGDITLNAEKTKQRQKLIKDLKAKN